MHDKGKKEENAFKSLAESSRPTADAAINTAAQPDELEARRRKHALDLDKWRNGEMGPMNVRDMPGGGANIALFEDAMKVNDAGRIGRGVGSMSGNANPNFVAALNKEQEMERHKMASGALEANVEGQLNANDEEMTGLYRTANARNMGIAGMREGRYESDQERYKSYLMRPPQPNFWKQLAMSAAQGAGQGASMAAGGA